MASSFLSVIVFTFLATHIGAVVQDANLQQSLEIRAVVDRYAFDSWKAKVATSTIESQRVVETENALTDFIQSMFRDLNAIYGTLQSSNINLDVRVAGIEFITDEDISLPETTGGNTADSGRVLTEFRDWYNTKSYTLADHTMLLTGFDLTSNGQTSNAGKAYVNGVCSSSISFSVNELPPTGSAVLTVAHEVGHNLGASHDGSREDCPGSTYIMASGSNTGSGSSNTFRFSPCSVEAFTASTHACLQSTTAAVSTAPFVGELYNPDEICQLYVGSTSQFCRNFYGPGASNDYSDVCTSIFCQSTTSSSCSSARGSSGTVCGEGKRCLLGNCVSSTTVPASVTDTCPFGDVPGDYQDGQTCSQLVASFPGNCYGSSFRGSCCASCQSVEDVSKPGCEYGDRSSQCADFTANQICGIESNRPTCCGLCDYTTGTTPAPTTAAPTTPAPTTAAPTTAAPTTAAPTTAAPTTAAPTTAAPTTAAPTTAAPTTAAPTTAAPTTAAPTTAAPTTAAPTTAAPTTAAPTTAAPTTAAPTTTTASPTTTTVAPTCTDGSTQCPALIPTYPYYCYNVNNENLCCLSCSAVNTGVEGCEYGDGASFCPTMNFPTDCYYNDDTCCDSCTPYNTGITGCEYGDRSSACALYTVAQICWSANNRAICCEKCADWTG